MQYQECAIKIDTKIRFVQIINLMCKPKPQCAETEQPRMKKKQHNAHVENSCKFELMHINSNFIIKERNSVLLKRKWMKWTFYGFVPFRPVSNIGKRRKKIGSSVPRLIKALLHIELQLWNYRWYINQWYTNWYECKKFTYHKYITYTHTERERVWHSFKWLL